MKMPKEQQLLDSIKSHITELQKVQKDCNAFEEDLWYRFYHQSFKVYYVQGLTSGIIKLFKEILPDQPMNTWFVSIVEKGTGTTFDHKHNEKWLEITRPMMEAYAHAKQFLDMMIKYGEKLKEPPHIMPSGWATVLYLYNMR